MSSLHKEVTFEGEIVGHMVTVGGWLEGNTTNYDRKLSLYSEDVIG